MARKQTWYASYDCLETEFNEKAWRYEFYVRVKLDNDPDRVIRMRLPLGKAARLFAAVRGSVKALGGEHMFTE